MARLFAGKAPFAGHRKAISSPAAYAASRRLGPEMRADGVQAALNKVEMKRRDLLSPRTLVFARSGFLVDGKLPAPALD